MPISPIGGRLAYQIPTVEEFRVGGDDHAPLSPDTLKVIEDESREIISKSENKEIKEIKPGDSGREKILSYFKAVVARMDHEGVTNFEAPDWRKARFAEMFRTKSAEMFKAINEQPGKLTNAAFKDMLDAMIDFRANVERSRALMKKGLPDKTVNSIWMGGWGRKIRRIAPELRSQPTRTERPKGAVFASQSEGPQSGRPKGRVFKPGPEKPARTGASLPPKKPPRTGAGLSPEPPDGGAPGKT